MADLQKNKDFIRIASQSIWNERHTHNLGFYCPICTIPRRISKRLKPGHPIHFLQVGLTAAVFTLATWPIFGIKGIVSFLPLWVGFEIIYRAKTRATLVCERCGFDPYLYLVDASKAKDAILAKRASQAESQVVSSAEIESAANAPQDALAGEEEISPEADV